jgi:serpin B
VVSIRGLAPLIAIVLICLIIFGVLWFHKSSSLKEEFVRSQLARDTSPNVTQEDLKNLANGNSAFALDLYQAVRDQGNNLFFSPYSVSLALAMTYAGAGGETAQQMADTLHFSLPQERLHPAFDALDLTLMGYEGGDNFTLRIANSLWGRTGTRFKDEFLDTLALDYGAGMRRLDFAGDPEGARLRINDWVSEQTDDKIRDLLPPQSINPLTVLVLTNAMYFKAAWKYAFPVERTSDGEFTLLDGSKVTVPMMAWPRHVSVRYAEGDGYKVVELPYEGASVSMLIILPELNRFEEFDSALSATRVEEILNGLEDREVLVRMPRFRYECPLSLADTLAEMGMPIAFTPTADFSGITTDYSIWIDKVLHKAFISVDEKGTEAAAATAVSMVMGIPYSPVEITLNSPFVFLIRDDATGTILFMGRVLNPVA